MSLLKSISLLLIVFLIACAPRGPVVGSASRPAGIGGTISGTVRLAPDGPAVQGRKVTAVNIADGQRIDTSTAVNGGYTMKVPVGRYRLEVELRPGETLTEQPGELEISASDMDASRNFVIAAK
jgi:hypothetical protein